MQRIDGANYVYYFQPSIDTENVNKSGHWPGRTSLLFGCNEICQRLSMAGNRKLQTGKVYTKRGLCSTTKWRSSLKDNNNTGYEIDL